MDESAGYARTWVFLDARIENVMQFERFKMKLKPASFLGWQAVGALAAMRYRWRAPPQATAT
jgi:ubiquinone biosynthesis protein COQ9